ncbi:MAG: ribosome-associated translation inhibitor RaiA [Sinobacteraceae bacterium]|nr:ribosome-associated translation inhibitor RaiA [Nevskiaceae bacterium]
MNLNLSGHHVDITPALREYVETKVKPIERHIDRLIGADVVLTVDKAVHRAEASLHLAGAKLHATASASQGDTRGDMYAAIDSLMTKLDEQARRHTERRHDKAIRQTARRRSANDGSA